MPSQGNDFFLLGCKRRVRPNVNVVPCDKVVRALYLYVVDVLGGNRLNGADFGPFHGFFGIVISTPLFFHCPLCYTVCVMNKRITINKYIVADPEICHGKPTFKGTRIMVWQVMEMLAAGESVEDIENAFMTPLTREQIAAALRYAGTLTRNNYVVVDTNPIPV